MKMQRISTGFNRLAPVYTLLTKIVFGGVIQKAQLHFLSHLTPDDRVLILGGGSGDLLKAILEQHPKLLIDYIDISPKMLELSRKKAQNNPNVNFIKGTEQNIPKATYSIVITNFYLDLFTDPTLANVITTIKKSLHLNAKWLVTDFVKERFWHRTLLWIMYRFFRAAAHIEGSQLPGWERTIEKISSKTIDSRKFYFGFIKTIVFEIG